jgi:hypothetical protein
MVNNNTDEPLVEGLCIRFVCIGKNVLGPINLIAQKPQFAYQNSDQFRQMSSNFVDFESVMTVEERRVEEMGTKVVQR